MTVMDRTAGNDGVSSNGKPASKPLAWIDIRGLGTDEAAAVIEAVGRFSVDGLLFTDRQDLNGVPVGVLKVGFPASLDGLDEVFVRQLDVLLVDASEDSGDLAGAQDRFPDLLVAPYVDVKDQATLDMACVSARTAPLTLLHFQDPTKIPLEIVLAAADKVSGSTVTMVNDVEEAGIVLGVLERGSEGVCLPARSAAQVAELSDVCRNETLRVALEEFEVEAISHMGLGDRACVDMCCYLEKDEGIVVGSFASAMFLGCSETHPLPYMPTRPFRVNAGAIHSYTLAPDNRTRYLSELTAGSEVLAIRADGTARSVLTGRVKIERRPLLSINARTGEGHEANVIVQDDWHVRMLGPGGRVHNVTELKPGDLLLGYVGSSFRHVGWSVSEFCQEQ